MILLGLLRRGTKCGKISPLSKPPQSNSSSRFPRAMQFVCWLRPWYLTILDLRRCMAVSPKCSRGLMCSCYSILSGGQWHSHPTFQLASWNRSNKQVTINYFLLPKYEGTDSEDVWIDLSTLATSSTKLASVTSKMKIKNQQYPWDAYLCRP